MNAEKDSSKLFMEKKRLQKLQTFEASSKSSKIIQKNMLKEELSKIKEISEMVYKEGISRLLDMTKNHHNLISQPKDETNNITQNITTLSVLKSKSKRLPKLSHEMREDSPITKFLSDSPSGLTLRGPLPLSSTPTNMNISNIFSHGRPSPQLQPLFAVSNCVLRAAFKSRTGTIKGKPKLHNQDSIMIKPNVQNIKGQYLFGVCDGHGSQGKSISEYVKEQLTSTLEISLSAEPRPDLIQKALVSTIEKVSADLSNSSIDIVFSGCACLNVFISGNNCVCANLGDCKAVIGKENEKWDAIDMNIEHNLQNKKERDRMIANNARIEIENDLKGENNVEKFYMGNQNVPGLEITRSIGDKIGKFIGMIATPDVKSFTLEPEHKFIIIGTRGLWKYLTSIEAVCIVRYTWENNKIEKSCEDLIFEAERRWKSNEIDKEDITAVVIYLNVPN